MSAHIDITRDNGVLIARLNRADKKNALTGAMYQTLIEAMDEADGDKSVGAILLTGGAGCFTSGNDIGDFLAAAGNMDDFPALRFIRRLAICDTPLVAAVDGLAVGVGTTLLFHCDLVYATATARFHMPFVDLGLVPEAAASLLVPRLVGAHKAAEWLLLGEAFGAEDALRAGLVNAVVGAEALHEHALGKARALAAKPRNALANTRKLLRGDRDSVLERIDTEARLFGAALRSQEAITAFTAFMAKGKK